MPDHNCGVMNQSLSQTTIESTNGRPTLYCSASFPLLDCGPVPRRQFVFWTDTNKKCGNLQTEREANTGNAKSSRPASTDL